MKKIILYTLCLVFIGCTIKSEYTKKPIPITPTSNVINRIAQDDGELIFDLVEKSPEFPGGDKAQMEFIGRHLRYPQSAKDRKIQGKLYTQFIVEKDGSLSNKIIMRSLDSSLDNEALKILNLMPKWIAGEQAGKKVRVRQTMPFNFRLN